MIVSRRSYLLSQPSRATISLAERSAAKRGVGAAYRMLNAVLRQAAGPVVSPVYLPPSLYAEAERQGHNMAGYTITPTIPTR